MLIVLLSAALGGPLAGETFPDLSAVPLTVDGVTAVPDPAGRYVVVELIRSADW